MTRRRMHTHRLTHQQDQGPSDRRESWMVVVRGLIALGLFVAMIVLFTAPAHAGTYGVYSCLGPANEPLGTSGWQQQSNGAPLANFDFTGDCATGLRVALDPAVAYANNNSGSLVFTAPADTDITGFELRRGVRVQFNAPGGTYGAVVRERAGAANSTSGCVMRTTSCQFGIPDPDVVTQTFTPLDSVAIEVSCNQASCPATGGNAEVESVLNSSRIDLADTNLPQIVSVTGTLAGSTSAPSTRTVLVSATDAGGGVRRIELYVDGALADAQEPGGTCVEPFSEPVPCPLNLTSNFNYSTAGLVTGAHVFTVRVVDAGGDSVTSGPFSFTITGAPPTGSDGLPLINGTPAVERPQMSVSSARIESRRGGNVSVSGIVRTDAGVPVVGATVTATATDLGDADAEPLPLGPVVTGSDGGFTLPVLASGAKRVRLSFRPNPVSAETAFASVVVRQALTLSIKRSKARVKPRGLLQISGALGGAGSAEAGAPVEIQTVIRGKWRAVEVVETNSRGAYKWRYRFVAVKRSADFKFRAIVRKSGPWPWPTKASSVVSVKVAR